MYLREFKQDDAKELLRLQVENQAFFEKFSMSRDGRFYTSEGQADMIKEFEKTGVRTPSITVVYLRSMMIV